MQVGLHDIGTRAETSGDIQARPYLIADVYISNGGLQVAYDRIYDGLQPASPILLCFLTQPTLTLHTTHVLTSVCASMYCNQRITKQLCLACVAASSASAARCLLACCSALSKSWSDTYTFQETVQACLQKMAADKVHLVFCRVSLLKFLLWASQQVQSVEFDQYWGTSEACPWNLHEVRVDVSGFPHAHVHAVV